MRRAAETAQIAFGRLLVTNFPRDGRRKGPVTVLTGFLGAGKTRLNHILTQNHGRKIAVIENEFGEVGVDDALVKGKFNSDEEIFEMNNGCICCTVRGDLIHAFEAIAKRKKKVDHVIIETTGLADPGPVAQTFFVDDAIKALARLDGIVNLVDAKHVEQHLDDKKADGAVNEAEQQVAFADRLLLNKVDLVSGRRPRARRGAAAPSQHVRADRALRERGGGDGGRHRHPRL